MIYQYIICINISLSLIREGGIWYTSLLFEYQYISTEHLPAKEDADLGDEREMLYLVSAPWSSFTLAIVISSHIVNRDPWAATSWSILIIALAIAISSIFNPKNPHSFMMYPGSWFLWSRIIIHDPWFIIHDPWSMIDLSWGWCLGMTFLSLRAASSVRRVSSRSWKRPSLSLSWLLIVIITMINCDDYGD